MKLNYDLLKKQGDRLKLGPILNLSKTLLCRFIAEIKVGRKLPKCFGVLYQNDKICKKCKVKLYCEYQTTWEIFNGVTLTESDIDLVTIHGFKEKSRPARIIARLHRKQFSEDDLVTLSKSMFNKTVIDSERILSQLRKRRLLVVIKQGIYRLRK